MKINWLLFKQGLRGIFKYKIQFIVIMLLTFFASFYLASITSLNARMNESYNTIVKDYDKFDYTYYNESNEASLTNSNRTYIPILDFVPNQTNSFISDNKTINDSFNLVLNDFNGYYDNSFITKALFDENMKPSDALKSAWNVNDPNFWSQLSRLFIKPGKHPEIYNGKLYLPLYGEKIENFDSSTGYKVMQGAVLKIVKALSEALVNEIQAEDKSEGFKSSLFFRTWEAREYKIGVNFDSLKMSVDGGNAAPLINTYKTEVSSKGEFQNYVYNALESVAYYIMGSASEFINNSYIKVKNQMNDFNWEDSSLTIQEKVLKYETEFNAIAESQKEMKIWTDLRLDSKHSNKEASDEIIRWNKELAFEYIFGTNFYEDKIVNENYIVDTNDLNNSTYQILVKNINPINNGLDLDKNGMRGLANPAAVKFNEKESYQITTKNDLASFERVNRGDIYSAKSSGKLNDYEFNENLGQNYYDWSSLYSYNIMHQKMAAEINNIELQIREEAFFYDNSNGTNYRIVITNDRYDYNFKVTAGLQAIQENEVVISQQYALKNNYKVGDKIKIGGKQFIISGFGSDALTYYPLVDPKMPIVDVKNSVIVYAPKYAINKIMNNVDSSNITFYNYFFVRNDGSQKEEEFIRNMYHFDADLKSNTSSFSSDYKNSSSIGPISLAKTTNNIEKFSETYFYLNWSLQPKVLSIVNIISIVSCIVILLIALISIVFGISKTVHHNASQIAILKAQGVNSYRISLSYLWYSIFITFITIPLAWIVSGFFQEILANLVSTYFSTTLYEFVWDYRILVFLILFLGLITIVLSYLITLILTSKNYTKILSNNENKTRKNLRIFELVNLSRILPFRYKMPMKLAIRGYKQVFMLFVTSLIVTVLITVTVATPVMLNIYIKDADKYIKYKNDYSLNESISGLPTSKSSLSASRGIEYTENLALEPKVLKGESKQNQISDIYFDNNKYYNDSNWDSSIMPVIMFGEGWTNKKWMNDFNWTEKWIFDENSNSVSQQESSKLMKLLLPIIGQIGNLNGLSFSPGTFEKISSYVWNTNVNPATGWNYFSGSNTQLDQNQVWDMKTKSYKGSIEFIQEMLSQMISLISGNNSNGLPIIQIPQGANWKESIMMLAQAFLPNSMQQYYKKSANTESQFNISLNSETYTPGKETLSTQVKTNFGKSTSTITGLKDNQKAYAIPNESYDKIFLKDSEIKKLNSLFSNPDNYSKSDIIANDGFVVYNQKTKTLNIPVVTNLKAEQKYSLDKNQQVNSMEYKALKIGNFTVPKNAWIYDNREITENMSVFDKDLNLTSESEWIDPSNIDPNKFTYTKEFEYDDNYNITSVRQDSKWFINSYLKNDVKSLDSLSFELRPYYHYNNLKLFVPHNVANINTLLNGEFASHSRKSKFNTNNWKSNIDLWHGKVNRNDVPDSVLNSWGSDFANVQDWEWISPFSLNYSKEIRDENRKGWINNIESDLTNIHTWAADKIKLSGSKDDIYVKTITDLPTFLSSVNIISVGNINTYNGNMIIADQDLLNLLTNKSTSKYIPVDYDFYGDPIKEINNGLLVKEDQTITIRNMKTPLELLKEMNKEKKFFMKDELMSQGYSENEAFNMVIQNRDFNNKFSNFNEPFGITNSIKGSMSNSQGIWALSDGVDKGNFKNLSSLYSSVELASAQLGIVTNVTESIIMISILIVVATLFISVLVISMICDIYIIKYHRFMLTMRSIGYNNLELAFNTALIPTGLSLVFVVLGYIGGVTIITLATNLLTNFGFFIPVVFYWWLPLAIVITIFILFFISFAFSLKKPMKDDLKILM
ncbi:hypothetical protein CG007_00845 [Mesoplasma entomophilum]|nr:hypothetical protein CG007_00845 [Mesoplasma entomophilum]